ncbi:hypothetical protein [Methanospirillum lacunae]|nr:hypothetical protein [Methanospirillum lacunae]
MYHPIFLNKTNDNSVPVMEYRNQEIPISLKGTIDHIDFQITKKNSGQVLVYFVQNPGFVSLSKSQLTSDFIVTRPEWSGNYSEESITSVIFFQWAENSIKADPILKHFLPVYEYIFHEKNYLKILHPVYISQWYRGEEKPIARYFGMDFSKEMSTYVDAIEYQNNNRVDAQMLIYLKNICGSACWESSSKIADYIMSKPEWSGDRTKLSITTEIFLHWVAKDIRPVFQINLFTKVLYRHLVIGDGDSRQSPVSPIHLGYYYAGLNETPVMDPFLKRI